MFCPSCGLEDKQSNQFCRACGSDLRVVRGALEKPDNITASAVSARDEIGRAVAARIRETRSAHELKKVAEDVLPQIEKFLESPEEKRLRRIRIGSIIASAGIGTAVALSISSVLINQAEDMLFLAGLGLIAFFVGLGFILNGIFLTVPKKSLDNRSSEADSQLELDTSAQTKDRLMPQPANLFSSVTENTTRHLKEKNKA